MSGWFACEGARWERTRQRLLELGPLEEDDARHDLRFLESETRHWLKTNGEKGQRWPGRPTLMERWRWTDREVRKLLAKDDWHDEDHPVALEVLVGTTWRKPRSTPVANSLPTRDELVANSTPAQERANANNPVEPSNSAPAQCQLPASSASIACVSSHRSTPSTPEGDPPVVPQGDTPPEKPPDLPDLLGGDPKLVQVCVSNEILTVEALTALTAAEFQHRDGVGPRRLAAVQARLACHGLAFREPPAKAERRRREEPPRPGLQGLTDRWMAAYTHVFRRDYAWTLRGPKTDQRAAMTLYDEFGWTEAPGQDVVDAVGGVVRRYLLGCRDIGRTPTLPDLVDNLARWRNAPEATGPPAQAAPTNGRRPSPLEVFVTQTIPGRSRDAQRNSSERRDGPAPRSEAGERSGDRAGPVGGDRDLDDLPF